MFLESLYKTVAEQKTFSGFGECASCFQLCSRSKNIHWLLTEEAEKLSSFLNISKINGAFFFEGGLCRLLKDGHCSIYENRPLECRLNPLSIYEVGGQLHWIIYLSCPVVHKHPILEFLEVLGPKINSIEAAMSENVKNEFRSISRAINSFEPLVPGRDFLLLKRFS